jgi:hypothetical protein
MDPYLEEPGLWPDVHHGLISEIQAQLNQDVGPNYFVRVEERVYVSEDDDPGREAIIPDVRIVARKKKEVMPGSPPDKPSRGEVTEPVEVITLLEEEIHEARLEIVDRKDRKLVTVLEVLSPTNKIAGSRGRASYLEKRQEVMNSSVHWVEIDLLRTGAPIIPRAMVPLGDYFVHVSRADRRPKGHLWPILMTEHLPVIKVPLKAKGEDVILDLQRVLDTAYDRGAYNRDIDYRKGPAVRLPKKYAAWARKLVRSKGLR